MVSAGACDSRGTCHPATSRRLAAVESPLRLQLGSDCVTLVEGKLDSVAKELDL